MFMLKYANNKNVFGNTKLTIAIKRLIDNNAVKYKRTKTHLLELINSFKLEQSYTLTEVYKIVSKYLKKIKKINDISMRKVLTLFNCMFDVFVTRKRINGEKTMCYTIKSLKSFEGFIQLKQISKSKNDYEFNYFIESI